MPQARCFANAILAAFDQAGCGLSPERAHRVAGEIVAYGGLDAAIAALAQDEAFEALADALAYRDLLREQDDPQRLLARLLREAGDLDARAEPAWAEAADLRGRAAHRHRQGEMELARRFLDQAQAAERFAAGLEEEAFRKRLRGAELEAGVDLRAALRDLAA
jgi:hypothetical protein